MKWRNQSVESVDDMKPVEVHIPDAPSTAEIKAVLEHLEHGRFYRKGKRVKSEVVTAHQLTDDKTYRLVPVDGIHWSAPLDPFSATFYIGTKAYTFPRQASGDWLFIRISS